jgi:nitric oxide reductase subunit C
MTKAYKRIGEIGIRERVKRPEVILAKSWRKMPQQNLGDDEIERLIDFFKWVSEIDTHDWPPQDSGKLPSSSIRRMIATVGITPGGALFKEKGCFGCHKIGGIGSDAGPPMEGTGGKYDVETLARYIVKPQKVDPDSEMPQQPEVSLEEAVRIAEFLKGIK